MKNKKATIEQALELFKAGKIIMIIRDEDEGNGGGLAVAAEYITPEHIDFMSRYSCGLISLSMANALIDKLQLPMKENNKLSSSTPLYESIESAQGVSTGNLAKDRVHTIKVAISPESGPDDVVFPGHIVPLRAKSKGVLVRAEVSEASVDLMVLAGLTPAALICDMIDENGTKTQCNELIAFAKKNNIPVVIIKDLIEYRFRHEVLVRLEASTRIPLRERGDFNMTLFENDLDNSEHFALVKPTFENQIPLVRIHSECITGDVFGSSKCDCGHQLNQSLSLIAAEGGLLIYLRQEGRGIGLANKLRAYALQEQGWDTVDANHQLGLPSDNRSYVLAYQILKYFGIETIRLLTNNPLKIAAIESFGIKVQERLPLEIEPTKESQNYLKTKKEKMGHFLDNPLLLKGNNTE